MPACPSAPSTLPTDAQILQALRCAPEGSKRSERLRNDLAHRLMRCVESSSGRLLRGRHARIDATLQEAVDEVTARVLLHAGAILSSWDPTVANLRTRCAKWVHAAVSDALREARPLPIPERLYVEAGRRHHTAQRLQERHARLLRDPSATDADFEALEREQARLDELEQLVDASECTSLGATMDEPLTGAHHASPEDDILTKVTVERLLADLDPVDQDLLLLSNEGYSLREVGTRHSFSHTWVRQRLERSMERMQVRAKGQPGSDSHCARRSLPRIEGLL